jgi:hypothetical protein
MSKIVHKDIEKFTPKGYVTMTVMDAETGQVIQALNLPKHKPNQATALAKVAAAHVLAGDSTYAVTKVEWGRGHNSNPSLSDTNLESPLYTVDPLVEGIFTPVSYEFPSTAGQVRFLTELTSTTPGISAFETPSVDIWEVGLRTNPLPGFPKGLLIARFVNTAPIQKSGVRVKIGLEWLYIYA